MPYNYRISDEFRFPVKEIYEVFQDPLTEHIFIGTNNGLFEYNGKDFILHEAENQTGRAVSCIRQDTSGAIWFRNFKGQVLKLENGKTRVFVNWRDSCVSFPRIYIDKDNRLFLSNKKGFTQYNISENKWLPTVDMRELENRSNVHARFWHREDKQYLFTCAFGKSGVYSGGKLSHFKYEDEVKHYDNRIFNFIGETYLYSGNRKIYKIKGDSLTEPTPLDLPFESGNPVYCFAELSDKNLAVGTPYGLFVYDENFRRLNSEAYFPNKKISWVTQDFEKNIWVASLQSGLFVIPNMEVLFYNSDNSQLPLSPPHSLFADSARLYIGFERGETGFLDKKGNFQSIYRSGIKYEVSNFSKHIKPQTFLFFQPGENGVIQDGKLKRSFQSFISSVKECKLFGQSYFLTYANGVLLVSSDRKEYEFLEPYLSETFIQHKDLNERKAFFGSPEFRFYEVKHYSKAFSSEYDAKHKVLWGAYNNGTFYFKNGKKHQLNLDGEPVFANEISTDKEGTVWLCTARKGLLGIKDTSVVFRHETGYSLSRLKIVGDFLWYAGEGALIRINLKTCEKRRFNITDGIPSSEIKDIEYFNGRIYLTTPDGLFSLPHDLMPVNEHPPKIRIKQILVNNKDTALSKKFVLDYNKNSFAVNLQAINYRGRGRHIFEYRLSGVNDNWVKLKPSESLVRFPYLSPGEYRLECRVLNEDGIRSKKNEFLDITVNPPLWQRWWTFILFSVFAGSSTILFFRIRMKRIRRRAEMEKQLKMSEITAIKAQMNPHFIFNALNSIQELILDEDIIASNEYLGKFSDLMRLILQISGKEYISLKTETNILQLYLDLEQLRFGTELEYKILIEENIGIPLTQIQIPGMIIQPYVENAIKHGLLHKKGNKHLEIKFYKEKTHFFCQIRDNGIGRKQAGKIARRRSKYHKSFASQANLNRIKLMNELSNSNITLKITDLYKDNQAAGTEVLLKFPLERISAPIKADAKASLN